MGKKVWVLAFLACCFVVLISQHALADNYVEVYDDTGKPYDYKLWERNGKLEQKVYEVGFRLLNANKFPKKVRFVVDESSSSKQTINACASYGNGTITVYKGILFYMENDDELAAVLAHEMGHIKQYSSGFWPWKRTKMYFAPKFYEYDADIQGVDYMVKAGYNPLAMISVMNRAFSETSKFRKFRLFMEKVIVLVAFYWYVPLDTHPVSSKRLVKIYNHIQTNYPQFLNDESNNQYYVNFLMNVENNKDLKELKEKYDIDPAGGGDL